MNGTLDLTHIQEIIAADSFPLVLDEPMLYPQPATQQHLWMNPAQMHPCHVQQQQQQQQIQQKNPYCSTTQLPDSPPDSGSEPYSPPNGERTNEMQQQQGFNAKPMMQPGYPHLQPAYRNYYPEPPKLNHQEALPLNPQPLLQMSHKKRRLLDSPPRNMVGMIKSEPDGMMALDEELCTYDYCGPPDMNASFLDGAYQVIKWQPYQHKTWATLLDQQYKELPTPTYRVDADKGFNFSGPDESFVCQKKNHFQVTVHIEIHGQPKFMKNPETGAVQPLEAFYLHFNGIKMESPSQSIKIEQSQSDRSKKAFYPVRVDLPFEQTTKVTVGRLHFSETTTNNMRKKGKPNPDQRYFMLVVALHGHAGSENMPISAQVSEKIIVRASNPGQFDQDVDVTWQKGYNGDSIHHAGRVGVNTDRPDEALTVHGNIKLTGHLMQPSDRRIKRDLNELDSSSQLTNIAKVKVYNYALDAQVADHLGVPQDQRRDTGVIAQEISTVLPDAVKETGDFQLPNGRRISGLQVVNKDRLYMENVGAVKELCKVTDKLENRIGELESIKAKLARYKSCSSLSTCSSISSKEKKDKENQEKKKLATTSSRHHHRHHCSRHGGTTSSEEGPFSNRFIQVTIFVLLVVMAFCLIAITALYAMKRHQNDDESNSSAVTTPTTTAAGSPFVPLQCLSKTCPIFCCNEKPLNDPGKGVSVSTATIRYDPDQLDPNDRDPGIVFTKTTPNPNDYNVQYNVVRNRRSVNQRAQLMVVQDNQTLERFCGNDACRTGVGSKFQYSVPLSEFYPESPITIHFKLADDEAIVLCKNETQNSCSGKVGVAIQDPVNPHQWTLPVGLYHHSTYTFQAGPKPQASLCQSKTTTVYELDFQRYVPTSCTMT